MASKKQTGDKLKINVKVEVELVKGKAPTQKDLTSASAKSMAAVKLDSETSAPKKAPAIKAAPPTKTAPTKAATPTKTKATTPKKEPVPKREATVTATATRKRAGREIETTMEPYMFVQSSVQSPDYAYYGVLMDLPM